MFAVKFPQIVLRELNVNDKQTQRDLLTILDRMSISIQEARADQADSTIKLLQSHSDLIAMVCHLAKRVEVLEDITVRLVSVVVSQTKVIESQAVLLESRG